MTLRRGEAKTAKAISFVPKTSPARRKELATAMKFVQQTRRRFNDLGLITSARTERASHDLAEIHGIFQAVSSRLLKITSQRSLNIAQTRRMLEEIQGELMEHLPYHLQQLKRPLDRLINDLSEDGADKAARRASRPSKQ